MNEEILVLSEMEAVRRNPGMYIGGVGEDGPLQLLKELVQNSLDESARGFGRKVTLTLNGEQAEVADEGRGIPTEIHTLGSSAAEVALTRLHAGSKFVRDAFTAGMHGVGLSCVNALSSRLELEIRRSGWLYRQEYARGRPRRSLERLGVTDQRGTLVRFVPDEKIFPGFRRFSVEAVREYLADLSFLHPEVAFELRDSSADSREVFHSPSGLLGLLEKISAGRRPLGDQPARIILDGSDPKGELVFQWTADLEPRHRTFVNGLETRRGGTHLDAVSQGILRAVNKVLASAGVTQWATLEEVMEGMAIALHCQVKHPQFEGQNKTRLTNEGFQEALARQAEEGTSLYFRRHGAVATRLRERILEVRGTRLASQRVSDRIYWQHAKRGIDEAVYKEQFGARSKNWHDSAVWIAHKELLKSHGDMCAVGEDSIALDVCCGSGVVGASFKGKVKKVIGLDLTPEMVKLASERLDEVHQGNVYDIPFPDATFDLVCTREVLHLLPYPERPVSEIFRVLKPGGQFVVGQILPFSADDGPWMYRVFKKKQPLIHNMFQEDDFRRLLLSPGFVDLEMKEMNVWESIDVWINSYETTAIHRHEIRDLYRNAPAEARAVHPFEILPSGEIRDLWRWCVFSVRKPG